jgi:hypothetical protein
VISEFLKEVMFRITLHERTFITEKKLQMMMMMMMMMMLFA